MVLNAKKNSILLNNNKFHYYFIQNIPIMLEYKKMLPIVSTYINLEITCRGDGHGHDSHIIVKE